MLELLAQVDPMALPLWAVLLFSASMFPIGILLPCGRCCFPPCSTCETGELPNTITVTFDGFPEMSSSPGPDLVMMSFSACYGAGAAARVTAPGGDPATDAGPISAVTLTDGGNGYAKLGRVEPTVTASGGTGDGATFGVTLSKTADECGVDYWEVSSVSVSGGTGYSDGDQLTFSIAEGDSAAGVASATVHTTRSEPTLELSAVGGSGATFSVSYTKTDGPPPTWSIDSISVTDGGTGYHDGDNLTISLGDDDVQSLAATAKIRTGRLEPTLSASVSSETGSGASLTVSITKTSDYSGDAWEASGITITAAGTGYAENDPVNVTATDGQLSEYGYFSAYVSSVDEDGAITAITIEYGGPYFKDDGIIASVDLLYGGTYYKDDSVPALVSVESGGNYYREDALEPPYVATVTPAVDYQISPSDGSGAVFSATVDDDTSSPTFGQVVVVAVDDGGDGYLAWETVYKKHCCDEINGKPIVLRRNPPSGGYGGPYADQECVWSATSCSMPAFPASIKVAYLGPTTAPQLAITSRICGIGSGDASSSGYYTTETLITDCSDFSFTASGTFRGTTVTATVEPGGDYLPGPEFSSDASGIWVGPDNCFPCCKSADDIPLEITASFTGETTDDYDGDYVLSRFENVGGLGTISDNQVRRWIIGFPGDPWPDFAYGFALSIEPCSSFNNDGGFYPISQYSRSYGGFVADAASCNRCHNECMTYAHAAGAYGLNQGPTGAVGPPGWFDPSTVGKSCDDLCQETPVCAPSPGDYVIDGFGTVTVT